MDDRRVKLSLDKGDVSARLVMLGNIQLMLGEAAGPFLMIELLMRHIAEMSPSMEEQIKVLTKGAKRDYVNYWDCDSKLLVKAIESEFSSIISKEELGQIKEYPARRDKFLHGVYPALMSLLQVEPTSRLQKGLNCYALLQPGEIYESFLSMERNGVLPSLRIYAHSVIGVLEKIANSLAV